jgi:glycosyltransferase involved in cell wall biosynthesis
MRFLPAPHQVLYESWNRWRQPRVQLATGHVDVVHATTVTVPPPGRAALAVTVHDLFPIDYPDQFTPRGRAMMVRGIDRARDAADVVLCSSDATMTRCLDYGFDAARTRHVPLGVLPVHVTDADVARARRTHEVDGPFVLFVGTIEPRKNLATLVDAFARVPADLEATLVIVGAPGWHTDITALTEPIRDRVRVLGAVDDIDLHALYESAAVSAQPSFAEGFGLPALEAMAHSTPTIVSAGSANEEDVADAGIVVPATDVDAWATAITRLLRDSEAAAALGARGRERAARYTWERSADEAVAAYQWAVDNRRR